MKVTIARLRSNVTYTGFNNHTLDPYFYCLVNWMETRPDLEFQTYNMSFDEKQKPKRTLQESDYWIIPSDAEYMYHDKVRSLDPRDIEKSNKKIKELKKIMNNNNLTLAQAVKSQYNYDL